MDTLFAKDSLFLFIIIAGGFMGMTYGMFSVRQNFFLDMVSLPEDKSPFSANARIM